MCIRDSDQPSNPRKQANRTNHQSLREAMGDRVVLQGAQKRLQDRVTPLRTHRPLPSCIGTVHDCRLAQPVRLPRQSDKGRFILRTCLRESRVAKRMAGRQTKSASPQATGADGDDEDRCPTWWLRESQKCRSTRTTNDVDWPAENARYCNLLAHIRARSQYLCVTTRAGTSDHPFQNHAQVRLRVHHIVIHRFDATI